MACGRESSWCLVGLVKDGGAHGIALDPGVSVDPETCPKQANQTPITVSRAVTSIRDLCCKENI